MLQKRKMSGLFLFILLLLLSGCGEKKAALTDGREVYVKEDKTEKKEEETETPEKSQEEQLFLVTGLDTEHKKITLKAVQGQKEEEYSYTGAASVEDKYGSNITMDKLTAGEMVEVKLEQNTLKSIRVSGEVFTYGDVHNFTINTQEKTVTVGKSSYYYEDDLLVFYHNNKISLAEISQWDTLCLKGIDKRLYAIQVTNGHGTVVLQNTGIFEGGNITIGNIMSLDIEPDMKIEVPEGTYLFTVANDGYGGSSEVTVEANREIPVNLEELKGEGPKYGTINFVLQPDGAALYLNGEMVDLSQPLQLKYGRYSLSARAEGYADWNRTLVVNSQSANIMIELQTTEEAEEESAKEEEAEEEKAAESESPTTTEDSGRAQEEAVKELIEDIRKDTLTTTDSSSINTN